MPISQESARGATLIVLRGIGQIMFQGHGGTGLCFLAGIAIASPIMLVGALIGAIVGPLTAYLASFNRSDLAQGIYGFNSTLVGLGTLFFLSPNFVITWVLLVTGSVLAAVITFLAKRFLKFPTYTAPFVVVTWIIIAIAHAMSGTGIDVAHPNSPDTSRGFIYEVLRGEAEVMLGANVITGILFLVGIALSDRWHAAMAFLGSLVGTAIADYHGDPSQSIAIGIYGYNGALAAIALFLQRKCLTLPLLAAIVATLITEFFPKELGVPALTAPFVLATWLLLATIQAEARLFSKL